MGKSNKFEQQRHQFHDRNCREISWCIVTMETDFFWTKRGRFPCNSIFKRSNNTFPNGRRILFLDTSKKQAKSISSLNERCSSFMMQTFRWYVI